MADRNPPRFQAPPRAAEVYARATAATSLGAVEQALGYTTRGESDLEEAWFEALRPVPLVALGDDDLAALLGRGMHLPLTLPLGLDRLRQAVTARIPPSLDLVRACGMAAAMARRGDPGLADEAGRSLAALLGAPWPAQGKELTETVCAALEAAARRGGD
jgi:hypothetical protein